MGVPTEKEQSPNVVRERTFGGCKDRLAEDLRLYFDTQEASAVQIGQG